MVMSTSSTGPCFFCSKPGTWCGLCKAYLCDVHRKDYMARLKQAGSHPVDTTRKVFDRVRGR